ncbi:MAG: DUF2167 domain-containing protein [Chitinophagaceae bacterium]
MKKFTLFITVLLCASVLLYAGDKDSTKTTLTSEQLQQAEQFTALIKRLDSAEKATHYQTGSVALSNGVAHLNLPPGFKYIDGRQSQFILESLWRNPPDASVLGMIVKDSFHLNNIESDWAFIITYDAMGYVKDDDADKIKYDELLADLKKGTEENNAARIKLGYDAMHLKGWAASPFYDKQNKVLHWAKEFSGADASADKDGNTLNYEIRVLGRKGVLSLNAVATMDQLAAVKNNIPVVLKMAQFDKGYKYEEFDSGIDNVAAWTIGGLVAGKLLAKAGIFVLILKFWKLIALGAVGAFAAIKRFINGRKKDATPAVEEVVPGDSNAAGS